LSLKNVQLKVKVEVGSHFILSGFKYYALASKISTMFYCVHVVL